MERDFAWTDQWETNYEVGTEFIPYSLFADFQLRGLDGVDCSVTHDLIRCINTQIVEARPELEVEVRMLRRERRRLLDIGFILLESEHDRSLQLQDVLIAYDRLVRDERGIRDTTDAVDELDARLKDHAIWHAHLLTTGTPFCMRQDEYQPKLENDTTP